MSFVAVESATGVTKVIHHTLLIWDTKRQIMIVERIKISVSCCVHDVVDVW